MVRVLAAFPLAFLFLFEKTQAQSSPFPTGSPATELLDRIQVLTGNDQVLQTDVRPFLRKNAVQLAQVFDTTEHRFLLPAELRDIRYLYDENTEHLASLDLPNTLFGKNQKLGQPPVTPPLASKFSVLRKVRGKPLARLFYETPANFYEVNSKYFRLRVNPMIDFEGGKSFGTGDDNLFLNRRGIELRGDVDDRVFFTTNIVETQAGLPGFVDEAFKTTGNLPGASTVKPFDSRLFKGQNGYDFLQSEARIGFHATHHIGVEFGRGTNFIGNGYRSLLLSDFAAPYPFLKINTKAWRLHYQNLFAELIPAPKAGDELLPRKYLAAHYLSLNLTRKWSVGLFESVVLHRSDRFEFEYLNPVIFYRTVEGAVGSPDNVLAGLNTRLNLGRRAQLYGQVLLDEFVFRYAVKPKSSEKGWWGNKFGGQIGAKVLNAFGLDHLDLQAELNAVRPYTYSHEDSTLGSYAHNGLPLAHPLGSNFAEAMLRAKWSPAGIFSLDAKAFFIKNADDPPGRNFGNNLQLSYDTRLGDFGNILGQGIGARTVLLEADMAFRLFHNGFLDLRGGFRRKNSDSGALSRSDYWLGAGFRMNIGLWRTEY